MFTLLLVYVFAIVSSNLHFIFYLGLEREMFVEGSCLLMIGTWMITKPLFTGHYIVIIYQINYLRCDFNVLNI